MGVDFMKKDLIINCSLVKMKIKILGTRGEIKASAPYHIKHSGLLVDNKILFDLGEKDFLKYKPKYIFITHLHPDHAFFVRKGEEFKTEIYAPEKYKDLKIKVLSGKTIVAVNSFSIMAIPTIHSKRVKSCAYLIKKGKQKILYTGDMIWINKKYHKFLKDLDLVITEGSFIRNGGMIRREKKTAEIYGHNGIPDLIKLFKKFTKNILFVHFGSWFYKDIKEARKKLQKLGEESGLKVYIGHDGKRLSARKLRDNILFIL